MSDELLDVENRVKICFRQWLLLNLQARCKVFQRLYEKVEEGSAYIIYQFIIHGLRLIIRLKFDADALNCLLKFLNLFKRKIWQIFARYDLV